MFSIFLEILVYPLLECRKFSVGHEYNEDVPISGIDER